MMPVSLARRFSVGYRVDAGMWFQSSEHGWPKAEPCLLTEPSPVGLFVAAELDDTYFTGLPFGPADVAVLEGIPNVTVEWHENDDLFDDGRMMDSLCSDVRTHNVSRERQ
jgi:hypothetical protein